MTGTDLKKMRIQAKLSQNALANLVGCHQVEISRWERGTTPLSKIKQYTFKLCLAKILEETNNVG